MRLALADGARSAQARVARGWGAGACNAAARLIEVRECGRLLPCPGGWEHRVACWREAHRHTPPRRLRLGAVSPEWTGLAGRLSEPDAHDRLARGILAVMPGDAPLASGARHDVVVPVEVEPGDSEGAGGTRLPAGVHVHRPDALNLGAVATRQDAFGADGAGIDQGLLRPELLVCQLRLDRLQRVVVLLGRGRRRDVGNAVRQVVRPRSTRSDGPCSPSRRNRAGARSARPRRRESGTTRSPAASAWGCGGGRGRRPGDTAAPRSAPGSARRAGPGARPTRAGPPPGARGRGGRSPRANRRAERVACGLVLGQALVFAALRRPLHPLGRDLRLEPVGRDGRQHARAHAAASRRPVRAG
jgi:hypothetical protein